MFSYQAVFIYQVHVIILLYVMVCEVQSVGMASNTFEENYVLYTFTFLI